jgi:hypothetical protein
VPAPSKEFSLSAELELERIVPLSQLSKYSTLSEDGWKRHHPDKIIQLSPRRRGVKLRDALFIKG